MTHDQYVELVTELCAIAKEAGADADASLPWRMAKAIYPYKDAEPVMLVDRLRIAFGIPEGSDFRLPMSANAEELDALEAAVRDADKSCADAMGIAMLAIREATGSAS